MAKLFSFIGRQPKDIDENENPKPSEETEEQKLEKFSTSLKALSDDAKEDWLPILHKQYGERFLKDNDRIWTVTSLFIPLSLAGLGALREGRIHEVFALACGSIALACFWYLVCAKHRKFQDDGLKVIVEIEKIIGVESPKIPLDKRNRGTGLMGSLKNTSIEDGRRYMLFFIIITWIAAVAYMYWKNTNGESEAQKPTKSIKIINHNS